MSEIAFEDWPRPKPEPPPEPLATRPPELWINDVRDAGGDW